MIRTSFFLPVFFILIFPLCDQLAAQENAALSESLEELLEGNDVDEQALEILIEDFLENDSITTTGNYKGKAIFNFIATSWGTFENEGNGFSYGDTLLPGPPLGARFRGRIGGSGFTVKTILENDPGEEGLVKPDHISSGIAIHPRGQPFRIYIGDYHVRQGFGLGFSTRPVFSSWKTEPHLVMKSSSGLRLHGSSDESRYLRGGAVESSFGKLIGRVFISARQLDAGVYKYDEEEYFTSIAKTGYHRTQAELEKKDALSEEISGAQIQYSGGRFEAGGIYSHFIFSGMFTVPSSYAWPPINPVYKSSASRHALFGRMLLGDGMLQAEFAGSSTGGSAIIIAYSGFFNKGLSYLLAFENTPQGFFSHNTAFSSALIRSSDKSTGRLNIMYRPRKKIGVQTDICLDGITDPVERSVSSGYKIRSRIIADLALIKGEAIVQSVNGRITVSVKIREADRDKSFFWQGEMGFSSSDIYGLAESPGSYFSFRSRYKSPSGKLNLQAGISMFSKRNQSPVFYTYEPDVLYGMSIPAMSGTGTRAFLVMKYQMIKSLRLEGKIWRAARLDSGEHKIGGKVQLLYNYQ